MSDERKKAAQLGMPYGTAVHRLRKTVLFHLLQRLGEDMCFRCGERIESSDALSMEHRQPWLDNDMARFWDINNITFAHLTCNSRHGRLHKEPVNKRRGPPGTAWCYRHKQFLPVVDFYRNLTNWNGLSDYCKACHRGVV